MEWLAILGVLLGVYYYFLTQLTGTALGQLQQVQSRYSFVAEHAEQIANSR